MARNDEVNSPLTQIIKFNDPKQERFRKHTNGYTGPKLNANRAQWSPSIPKIKEVFTILYSLQFTLVIFCH